MVFGGSMKSPLINRFQLRTMSKNTETSILTPSFDSDDDDSYDSSKVDLITPGGKGGVYNFDDLKDQLDDSRSTRPMTLLPIPLPCIEPSTTLDFDDTKKEDSSPQCSSSVRFRWNSIRSQFSSTKVVDQENWADDADQTMKPFFTCGIQSSFVTPMTTDAQHNSMEGYECSDDTSLLRGRTVHKVSKFFTTSVNTYSSCEANAPISAPVLSKKSKYQANKIDNEEQYMSLIADEKHTCHDWMHGNLAFDLEYLEENNGAANLSLGESMFSQEEEEPYWALHPDDIAFEVPPPPPPPPTTTTTPQMVRSNKSRKKPRAKKNKNDRKYSDESFMKLVEGYETTVFLDELIEANSKCESSSTEDIFDRQQVSWQDFDAEILPGYANRTKQSVRKISPIVRNRFGRYSTMTHEIQQRSHKSRAGRRRSGRRSPPILLGRQFATNLSTVTERPSEEEANSSCIPTPMSTKSRQFFTTYESDTSSNVSGEGTAETCSSKDSST